MDNEQDRIRNVRMLSPDGWVIGEIRQLRNGTKVIPHSTDTYLTEDELRSAFPSSVSIQDAKERMQFKSTGIRSLPMTDDNVASISFIWLLAALFPLVIYMVFFLTGSVYPYLFPMDPNMKIKFFLISYYTMGAIIPCIWVIYIYIMYRRMTV